jgi:hypothetical protein
LNLSDELFREAKIAAIKRGVTFRELVAGTLEKELHGDTHKPEKGRRVDFPIIRSKHPGRLVITADDIRQIELE